MKSIGTMNVFDIENIYNTYNIVIYFILKNKYPTHFLKLYCVSRLG